MPVCPAPARAFGGGLGGDTEDIDDDEILAALGEEIENDFQNLADTCRVELRDSRGVDVPVRRGQVKRPGPYGWVWDGRAKACKPVGNGKVPAEMTLGVPTAGAYRLWLRFRANIGQPHPITINLHQGDKNDTFNLGVKKLSSESSKRQEKAHPIRFEDEAIRSAFPMGPTWLWEYRDVDLIQGTVKIELRSADSNARATTFLLTRSKSFIPNLSPTGDNNTLRRMYYRFRILPQPHKEGAMVSISRKYLSYHWCYCPRGFKGTFLWLVGFNARGPHNWGPPIVGAEGRRSFPAGTWTDWVDVTWSSKGVGPWGTANLGFKGVKRGRLEAQIAWYPDAGAVLKTITLGIENGAATFMMPLNHEVAPPVLPYREKSRPVWGMVRADYLKWLESASDVHRRHLAWAAAAEKELGLTADHPRPKRLVLNLGNSSAPAARLPAAKMLVRLGINSIINLPGEICRKVGIAPFYRQSYADWGYIAESHDPCDPAIPDAVQRKLEKNAKRGEKDNPDYRDQVRTVFLGDEIGVIAGAAKINASRDCKAHFHAYLRKFLRKEGLPSAFFGVESVEELSSLASLEEEAGLFERRLYYHSHLHRFALSADYYRHTTDAARRIYPNVQTYANFSPHPIVLGSQTMNHSEWFYLTRQGGASMAGGEDWAHAWATSGYHGMGGVSYYAAWVECAARGAANGKDIPSSFIAVVSCGTPDHKLVSLVSRGIKQIYIYNYGPAYALADARNAWSEQKNAYPKILRGTCALGPADEILAEGIPETRRVAILYNRTHEIMSGGNYGMQADRALTFVALGNAHHNADIILVEDLIPVKLAQYRVLYLNGFNLPAAVVPAIREWITQGGTLVGAAGAGMKDEYNDPLPATAKLFGTRQIFAARSEGSPHPLHYPKHEPVGRVTLQKTDLTPALQASVVGSRVVLKPITAQGIATWEDGSCAATIATVGKGKAVLFGFMPGILYKGTTLGSSRYTDDRRGLVVKPARAVLGTPSVEISAKQVEVSRFDHESGIAITLNNLRFWEKHETTPMTILSVKTDRKVASVTASLAGKLAWKREDGRIVIELPLPESVDVVVLR